MKRALMKLVEFSVDRPKLVVLLILIFTILLGIQFPKIKIDTDPENMLRKDEPVRIFHDKVKKDFGIEPVARTFFK